MERIRELTQAPGFLARVLAKINEVVRAVNAWRGVKAQAPIKLTQSENGVLMTLDLAALMTALDKARLHASGSGGGVGGGGVAGGNIRANELHFNDGVIKIDIDANGVKLTNVATGDYAKMYTTGALGIFDQSSGAEFTVAPSDLATTGSIIPRDTGLYDGGVPVSAYVLRGPTS